MIALATPTFKIEGEKGAIFGPGRVHRYWLWRVWEPGKRCLVFIGLNPSTADETKNDPTVERMERRARSMGYGGLIVVNIFAFRATDPKDMIASADPIGQFNDEAITRAVYDYAGLTVAGWGAHGVRSERGRAVKQLLLDHHLDYNLAHLGLTKSGQPKHPLYISYETAPVAWRIAP